MIQQSLFKPTLLWERVPKFDYRCCELADRHYSRRKVGSPQFMNGFRAEGAPMILRTNRSPCSGPLRATVRELVAHAARKLKTAPGISPGAVPEMFHNAVLTTASLTQGHGDGNGKGRRRVG